MTSKRRPYFRFVIEPMVDGTWRWRLNQGAKLIAVSRVFALKATAIKEAKRLKTYAARSEIDTVHD